MAQTYDYEIIEEGNSRKAKIQSAGVLDLDGREGNDEEAIKAFISSVQNVNPDDIELNKTELGGDVITSSDTKPQSTEQNLQEDVRRKNRK